MVFILIEMITLMVIFLINLVLKRKILEVYQARN